MLKNSIAMAIKETAIPCSVPIHRPQAMPPSERMIIAVKRCRSAFTAAVSQEIAMSAIEHSMEWREWPQCRCGCD